MKHTIRKPHYKSFSAFWNADIIGTHAVYLFMSQHRNIEGCKGIGGIDTQLEVDAYVSRRTY